MTTNQIIIAGAWLLAVASVVSPRVTGTGMNLCIIVAVLVSYFLR